MSSAKYLSSSSSSMEINMMSPHAPATLELNDRPIRPPCRQLGIRLRRRRNTIERKVRVLKKLVPATARCSVGMGVEGLFRDVADHIVGLQDKINLMQTMLTLLSPPPSLGSEHHHQSASASPHHH